MTTAGNELLGRDDFAVPLPLALEWASAHRGDLAPEIDGESATETIVACVRAADEG
jgi:hypothetical protein